MPVTPLKAFFRYSCWALYLPLFLLGSCDRVMLASSAQGRKAGVRASVGSQRAGQFLVYLVAPDRERNPLAPSTTRACFFRYRRPGRNGKSGFMRTTAFTESVVDVAGFRSLRRRRLGLKSPAAMTHIRSSTVRLR